MSRIITRQQSKVLAALIAKGGEASIEDLALELYGSAGVNERECVRAHIYGIRGRVGNRAIRTKSVYVVDPLVLQEAS